MYLLPLLDAQLVPYPKQWSELLSQPQLRPRLRRFLVALVLVMSAQEALAQVRYLVKRGTQPELVLKQTNSDKAIAARQAAPERYYAEQMPTFRGNGYQEIASYVQQRLVWPKDAGLVCVEGRIFIRFTVETDGSLRNVQVVKGLHPLLDAEAVRAVRMLGCLQPGRDHGKTVAVTMTVPLSFDHR